MSREDEILRLLRFAKKKESLDSVREMMDMGSTYDWTIHNLRKRKLQCELGDIQYQKTHTIQEWETVLDYRTRINNIITEVSEHNLDMGKYLKWIKAFKQEYHFTSNNQEYGR